MSYFKGTKSRDANQELIENYGWCEEIVKTPMIVVPPKEEPEQQSESGRTAVYHDKEVEIIVGKSVDVKQ